MSMHLGSCRHTDNQPTPCPDMHDIPGLNKERTLAGPFFLLPYLHTA